MFASLATFAPLAFESCPFQDFGGNRAASGVPEVLKTCKKATLFCTFSTLFRTFLHQNTRLGPSPNPHKILMQPQLYQSSPSLPPIPIIWVRFAKTPPPRKNCEYLQSSCQILPQRPRGEPVAWTPPSKIHFHLPSGRRGGPRSGGVPAVLWVCFNKNANPRTLRLQIPDKSPLSSPTSTFHDRVFWELGLFREKRKSPHPPTHRNTANASFSIPPSSFAAGANPIDKSLSAWQTKSWRWPRIRPRVTEAAARTEGPTMKKTLSLTAAILLFSALGFASFRQSANYRLDPDAVTGGGGRAASTSHVAPQQAVGQTAGLASSASYRSRAGVVQAFTVPQGPPSGWLVF